MNLVLIITQKEIEKKSTSDYYNGKTCLMTQ